MIDEASIDFYLLIYRILKSLQSKLKGAFVKDKGSLNAQR